MNEAWRSYSSAPDEGAPVCPAGGVPEGQARCIVVTTEKGEFPLVLVRRSGKVGAYVNACPHQYLPLNYRSETVLSADDSRLLCSVHGAAFDAGTGDCLSGAAEGLDPVPVVEDEEGTLRIGGRNGRPT